MSITMDELARLAAEKTASAARIYNRAREIAARANMPVPRGDTNQVAFHITRNPTSLSSIASDQFIRPSKANRGYNLAIDPRQTYFSARRPSASGRGGSMVVSPTSRLEQQGLHVNSADSAAHDPEFASMGAHSNMGVPGGYRLGQGDILSVPKTEHGTLQLPQLKGTGIKTVPTSFIESARQRFPLKQAIKNLRAPLQPDEIE